MLGLEDRDIFFNEKVEELVELPKDAKFILNAGWMASPVSNWEIAYYISKKGYYYKQYKNGKKVRISYSSFIKLKKSLYRITLKRKRK